VWNRHNEFIDGQYVGGKRYKDRSEWVITRNTHEAMISDDEASAILKLKEKQRRKVRTLRKNNYLLSTLLSCTCGANLDGDGDYYRYHNRCGSRGTKKETLEKGALDLLLTEFLTIEHFRHLKKDVEKQHNNKHSKKDNLLDQLESELKDTDRQINEIVTLLPKVKHQRPLLDRLDQLEEERVVLLDNIAQEDNTETPTIVKCSNEMLEDFVENYRQDLECGETERKKAVLRTLIEDREFDGESLRINPSYASVTGVHLASPRGFEPLLPP
jgi:site-specific DNA recombinase